MAEVPAVEDKLLVYGLDDAQRQKVDAYLEKHPDGEPGEPDPFDGGWGPRSAQLEQLEGPELGVKEVGSALHLSESAVTRLAQRSYELIEADLWEDLTKRAFSRELDEKTILDHVMHESTPPEPVHPTIAAVLARREARYKHINAFLNQRCEAEPVGYGWVRPTRVAREKAQEHYLLSSLWRAVLLRRFPSSTNGLKSSRECEIITNRKGRAFAITKPPSGKGRGNAWTFRRARVDVRFEEWRDLSKLPNFIVNDRDLLEVPKVFFTESTRRSEPTQA